MKKDGTMSVCSECGGEYYVSPSHRAGSSFCSRLCRAKGQSKWQARDLATRFWAKVDKSGGCWLWTGATLKTGYGSIRVEHKAERAHRIAYQLVVGPIPSGQLILHSCDTPACVNPSHLRLGSKRENTLDAIERGQHAVGDKHRLAKLSNSDVLTIRAALAAGVTGRYLARKFSVDESAISAIKLRKKRRHG